MGFKISLGNVSKSEELGDWYLDYSSMTDLVQSGYYGILDKFGIPIVDYDKLFKKNMWYIRKYKNNKFGMHYTPITIAQYAFGLLYEYNRDGDEKKLNLFKKCADWFVENVKDEGNYGVWEHTWIEPVYNIEPPWFSAMTQGEAISLLLRAYQIFYDSEYLSNAEKALNSFKETNIIYNDENKNIWCEENPTDPPNHILNGFIFAFFGLFDFYRMKKDKVSFSLWNEGIKTLEKNLYLYDSGYWSRYDLLFRRITSETYHNIHICQLKVLYNLTRLKVFYNFYKRWENYKKSRICYLKRKINGRIYNRIISKYFNKYYYN
ncbi:MAG: hypothetical protein HWN67_22695 [Candidatus Helarchaeota archaeon]|nr:hypothetical protein [Candidatus Helarchaeota archaeon]